MHKRLVPSIVGVAVVAVALGVLGWRVLDRPSTYEQALSTLPRSTLRTTFTDWSVVRRQAKGDSLDAGSSRAQVAAFLNRAYDLDLTSGSGIDDSTSVLARRFGFSPLDAEWEALGQSRGGQVDVLKVATSVDLAKAEKALRRLGYTAPTGTGVTWVGSPELVATISADLTPLQQNVAVLPQDHLVLMSDDAAYLSEAADVARGTGKNLTDAAGVSSLAERVDDPAAAVQWTSTFACRDLAMGTADAGDQRVGQQLVAAASTISPLEGLVMAQQPDRRLIVGMHFETSDQASANLQPRVDLASGAAPGQGGSFRDRFRVTAGEAHGHDVVLSLKPATRSAVLSDISTGPVLFATC